MKSWGFFPACVADFNTFFRQENGSGEALEWASRATHESEAGSKGLGSDSNATHQQLGGGREGNKEKPHCVASHRASSSADFSAHQLPGEPEIALLSLICFLEKQ